MTLSDRLPANRLEWRTSDRPVAYPEAVAAMEARLAALRQSRAGELVWLLEHPALYTAGTSARAEELREPGRLPVFETGRGGRYTYHGPGQRIAYAVIDLRARQLDVRRYVASLEQWIIEALLRFNVKGERRAGRVGVWVHDGAGEAKIAAIGLRVRHGIAFHGLSLNVDPELAHYRGIVPCGIAEYPVTSLAALGLTASMPEVDMALRQAFAAVFGEPAGRR
ncbi:MAG: lipoyl(octanoyl) transferase LipB [Alphaproteobacteria bacterium]|nr:lipoyl(octanoyl) transferase LipB [Alphaproteobacteria bacterium]